MLYLLGFRLPTQAQLDALDAHLEAVMADVHVGYLSAEYKRAEGIA